MVGYVPGIIVNEENTKKKTASLRLFLKIAKSCLDLGNYAGALAITYGLKTPSSLTWISAWEVLAV
jgi:RasGEF domain